MKKKLFCFFFALADAHRLQSCARRAAEQGVVLKDNTVVHYLEEPARPLGPRSRPPAVPPTRQDSMRLLGAGAATSWPLTFRATANPGQAAADYSIEYQASALADFLDALEQGKAALAGNSMGGWIAASWH